MTVGALWQLLKIDETSREYISLTYIFNITDGIHAMSA